MALERIISSVFESLARGSHLSRADAKEVFQHIMSGRVPETTMAGLLGAMAVKGESVDELVGAAEVMRENAIDLKALDKELKALVLEASEYAKNSPEPGQALGTKDKVSTLEITHRTRRWLLREHLPRRASPVTARRQDQRSC